MGKQPREAADKKPRDQSPPTKKLKSSHAYQKLWEPISTLSRPQSQQQYPPKPYKPAPPVFRMTSSSSSTDADEEAANEEPEASSPVARLDPYQSASFPLSSTDYPYRPSGAISGGNNSFNNNFNTVSGIAVEISDTTITLDVVSLSDTESISPASLALAPAQNFRTKVGSVSNGQLQSWIGMGGDDTSNSTSFYSNNNSSSSSNTNNNSSSSSSSSSNSNNNPSFSFFSSRSNSVSATKSRLSRPNSPFESSAYSNSQRNETHPPSKPTLNQPATPHVETETEAQASGPPMRSLSERLADIYADPALDDSCFEEQMRNMQLPKQISRTASANTRPLDLQVQRFALRSTFTPIKAGQLKDGNDSPQGAKFGKPFTFETEE